MAIFNKRVPTFFYELLNKPLEEVKKILGIGQQTFTDTNITEGTLNTATTDRTVDLGGNTLTVTSDDGTYTGDYLMGAQDFSFSALQSNGNNVSISTNVAASSLLTFYSEDGTYRIGLPTGGKPPMYNDSVSAPIVLSLSNTGYLKHISTEPVFVGDTTISPAIGGHPTVTEVRTHLVGLNGIIQGNYKNRYIYYTGTDTSTDTPTYVFFFTGNKQLFLIEKPREKMYSLSVAKGGEILTSANNGIKGDLVSTVDFWDVEHTRLNFKFSWDATPSSGSCDIIVRADFNNMIIYQTTIADMSQAGGHFGVHTSNSSTGNNTYGSFKGYYVELTNITGDVHNFAGSFVIKEGK